MQKLLNNLKFLKSHILNSDSILNFLYRICISILMIMIKIPNRVRNIFEVKAIFFFNSRRNWVDTAKFFSYCFSEILNFLNNLKNKISKFRLSIRAILSQNFDRLKIKISSHFVSNFLVNGCTSITGVF